MKLSLTLLCLFFITSVFSQKEVDVKSEWSIVHEEANTYTISQRSVNVNDKQNGIFKSYYQYKFLNHTGKQLFLSWNFLTSYNNFSSSQSPNDENYRALILEPESTFIPDFLIVKDKAFFVFKQFLKRQTNVSLESVEFHELKFKSL